MQCILRSHKIYWDLTRSTEISQDLLRSQKIYRFGILHLTCGIWHLTFEIWHSKCHDIPWHFTFDIDATWHLKFDMPWHSITFDVWHIYDIWHLTWLKVLTALALILMILAQSYLIITDGLCGYLSNLTLFSRSHIRNLYLRYASTSKNCFFCLLPSKNGSPHPHHPIENLMTRIFGLAETAKRRILCLPWFLNSACDQTCSLASQVN